MRPGLRKTCGIDDRLHRDEKQAAISNNIIYIHMIINHYA
ncbi:hypothetical protein STW0522RAO56_01280 [Raoultella planticola]|nr:hypothetical protein STW0522RAO56_01280 [Raoultella planticola]